MFNGQICTSNNLRDTAYEAPHMKRGNRKSSEVGWK